MKEETNISSMHTNSNVNNNESITFDDRPNELSKKRIEYLSLYPNSVGIFYPRHISIGK
jgi:hypothetical protein